MDGAPPSARATEGRPSRKISAMIEVPFAITITVHAAAVSFRIGVQAIWQKQACIVLICLNRQMTKISLCAFFGHATAHKNEQDRQHAARQNAGCEINKYGATERRQENRRLPPMTHQAKEFLPLRHVPADHD